MLVITQRNYINPSDDFDQLLQYFKLLFKQKVVDFKSPLEKFTIEHHNCFYDIYIYETNASQNLVIVCKDNVLIGILSMRGNDIIHGDNIHSQMQTKKLQVCEEYEELMNIITTKQFTMT